MEKGHDESESPLAPTTPRPRLNTEYYRAQINGIALDPATFEPEYQHIETTIDEGETYKVYLLHAGHPSQRPKTRRHGCKRSDAYVGGTKDPVRERVVRHSTRRASDGALVLCFVLFIPRVFRQRYSARTLQGYISCGHGVESKLRRMIELWRRFKFKALVPPDVERYVNQIIASMAIH
jgi:hypothetical protein